MDLVARGRRAETAIRAGDHVLASDDPRVAHEALRHQFRVLDQRDTMRHDAGQQHLALGQLDVLPDRPFMIVPRVRRLEGIGGRLDLQHQVDVVLELEIGGARRDVRAVAGVEAHAILGNAAQRVVEDLDPQGDEPPAFLHADAGRAIPVGHELWVVDLQQEAGIDDRLVLLVHRIGEGGEIFLLRPVIVVAVEHFEVARRQRGDEGFLDPGAGERGLEIGDVGLYLLLADIGDRAAAAEPAQAGRGLAAGARSRG